MPGLRLQKQLNYTATEEMQDWYGQQVRHLLAGASFQKCSSASLTGACPWLAYTVQENKELIAACRQHCKATPKRLALERTTENNLLVGWRG